MGASKICTSPCLKRSPLLWRSRFGKRPCGPMKPRLVLAHRVSHLQMAVRVLEHSSKRRFRLRCEEHCAGCAEARQARAVSYGIRLQLCRWRGWGLPAPRPPESQKGTEHRLLCRIDLMLCAGRVGRNGGFQDFRETLVTLHRRILRPWGPSHLRNTRSGGRVPRPQTASWRRAQVGTTHHTRGSSLRRPMT